MKIVLECELPLVYLSWPFHERVLLLSGTRCDKRVVIDGWHAVPNRSARPKSTFAVATADYRRVCAALPRDRVVVGLIHSHPPHSTQEPSQEDLDGIPEGWVGGIVCGGALAWY